MNPVTTCPNSGTPGPLSCPVPRCPCCTPPLRDEIAVVLHKLFCDMPRCDHRDGPCWTAWRQEADLVLLPVEVALCRAWEEGARDGSRGLLPDSERAKRNPYTRTPQPNDELCACGWSNEEHDPREHRPSCCEVCQGLGGWTGHHGAYEPCPKCDPPPRGDAA